MSEKQQKDFYGWIKLKAKLHYEAHICAIKNGDIWWCGLGENVGAEINGKASKFARPVLVIRKLSQYNFIGVPLTSKEHRGSWYIDFRFQNKKEIAVVAQVRNISTSRLYSKMGEIPESVLKNVRLKLASLILGKNIP
ncbi:type II toxin-antitoxin system PemK/MazF family toxin [Candidatus Saccharibacteria bacterium]|nr:type II toxin-antitoxin system PemK/MazF family toxin [Candidatus Saccharibacteria bacterium]